MTWSPGFAHAVETEHGHNAYFFPPEEDNKAFVLKWGQPGVVYVVDFAPSDWPTAERSKAGLRTRVHHQPGFSSHAAILEVLQHIQQVDEACKNPFLRITTEMGKRVLNHWRLQFNQAYESYAGFGGDPSERHRQYNIATDVADVYCRRLLIGDLFYEITQLRRPQQAL